MKKKLQTFDYFNIVFMILLAFVTLYPFWNQVVVSLSSAEALAASKLLLWPKELTLASYKLAFEYKLLWSGYRNTIIRTVMGVVIGVSLTALVAYPLSKKDLPFKRVLTGLFLFTMIFNGGLIPTYMLIKKLNLMDTYWALVLPTAVSAFNVLIMRNFFMQIPISMEESAHIDGAGPFGIFWSIILPLSKPVLATVTLWILVSHWNDWFAPYLYIRDTNKQVLQTVLRKIVIENNESELNMIKKTGSLRKEDIFSGEQLEATMTMLAILPMMIFYPFIQKYFVKGVFVGSVKG
ncbi:carbohydrate ABC transporter permease [Vallitalea okinawensis]|uniref:carbohydrate ABC transporter permease n=1 Tax=Vallitalea okinawensis TaxID=2078660 RepID=UPI000CFD007E|nr:carbohydrate ABC transporter permease [Vallitalea okinawensis]